MKKNSFSKLTHTIANDFSQLLKNRFIRVALVAVSIIPLLYAALYLWAFWDPYGSLNQLPVAIVNQDTGSQGVTLVKTIKDANTLKWNEVTQAQADQGLQNKNYYMEVIIPSNFSDEINSLNTSSPQSATLIYKPRQANGLVASQITSRVVDAITTELNKEISTQSFKAFVTGSHDLAGGLQSAANGASQLHVGLVAAQSGSESVTNGASSVASGSKQISAAIIQAKGGVETLVSGSSTLATGTDQLQSGLTQFKNSFASSSQSTAAALYSAQALLVNPDDIYAPGVTNAAAAQGILSQVLSAMQSSTATQSLDQLISGATAANSGSHSLNAGLSTLATKLGELNTAGQKLSTGAAQLSNGASQLNSGIASANSGAATLDQSIQAGATSALKQTDTAGVDGKAATLAEPVKLQTTIVDPVANYGTGFAPYFIPLALWVGALVIFLVIQARKSTGRVDMFGQYLVAASVGIIQAIILDATLLLALHMQVNHLGLFFLESILISLCSVAILQLLVSFFGDAGKFLGILLLMLQLTSSAGTYPLETLSKFFQKIHPYLPMTYAVNALREIISGGDAHTIVAASLTLAMFTLVTLMIRQLFYGKEFGNRFTIEGQRQ